MDESISDCVKGSIKINHTLLEIQLHNQMHEQMVIISPCGMFYFEFSLMTQIFYKQKIHIGTKSISCE